MPLTHTAKYPIVDPAPSVSKAIANYNLKDLGTITLLSTSFYVYGWLSARKPFRIPQSRFCGTIGLFCGLTAATLNSVQRFMGLEPNAREVQLYGIISPEELEKKTKQMNTPNIQLIDSEAD